MPNSRHCYLLQQDQKLNRNSLPEHTVEVMMEEISLDDIPKDEIPSPVTKPMKREPAYYEEDTNYMPFDSGSPFTIESTSLSTDTQS